MSPNRFASLLNRLGPAVCAYCHLDLDADSATIDHYVPKCNGGNNLTHNLRWACYPCNQAKNNLDAADFVASLLDPSDVPPAPVRDWPAEFRAIVAKVLPAALPDAIPEARRAMGKHFTQRDRHPRWVGRGCWGRP